MSTCIVLLSKKLTSSPGSPSLPCKYTLRKIFFFKIMNKPATNNRSIKHFYGGCCVLTFSPLAPGRPTKPGDPGGPWRPSDPCSKSTHSSLHHVQFLSHDQHIRIIIKPIITYSGSRRTTVSLLSLYPHSWFTLHYSKATLSTRQCIIQLPSASITYR